VTTTNTDYTDYTDLNVFTQVDGKVAEWLVFACRCPNYHPMYDLLVAYAAGTNRTVPLSQRKVGDDSMHVQDAQSRLCRRRSRPPRHCGRGVLEGADSSSCCPGGSAAAAASPCCLAAASRPASTWPLRVLHS
jgi:hypothetical protein